MEQMTDEQRKELEEKLKNMSPEELLEFQKQQCIFCQIIGGGVPSKKLFEDDSILAVLDINPATRGHVLVLPKEHYAIMPQIPEQELGHLFTVSKKVSQAILKGLKVQGTSLFIANGLAAGQRAQHFMIHLIPRQEGDGILPFEPKFVDDATIQKVRTAIENPLNQQLGVKKEVVADVEPEVEEPEEETAEELEAEEDTDTAEEPEEQDEEPEGEDDQEESNETNLDDIAGLFK